MKNYGALFLIITLMIISKCTSAQEIINISNNDTLPLAPALIQNPVYDQITCSIEGAEFLEYQIYDLSGKQERQGWFLGSIPVKYLEPGSYELIINFNDKKIRKKFMKLKSESLTNEPDEMAQ